MLGQALAVFGSLWFVIVRQVVILGIIVGVAIKLWYGKPLKEVYKVLLGKKKTIPIIFVMIVLYMLLPNFMVKTMHIAIIFVMLLAVLSILVSTVKNSKFRDKWQMFEHKMMMKEAPWNEVWKLWKFVLSKPIRMLAITFLWAVVFSEHSIAGILVTIGVLVFIPVCIIESKILDGMDLKSKKADSITSGIVIAVAVMKYAITVTNNWLVLIAIQLVVIAVAVVFFVKNEDKMGDDIITVDPKDIEVIDSEDTNNE